MFFFCFFFFLFLSAFPVESPFDREGSNGSERAACTSCADVLDRKHLLLALGQRLPQRDAPRPKFRVVFAWNRTASVAEACGGSDGGGWGGGLVWRGRNRPRARGPRACAAHAVLCPSPPPPPIRPAPPMAHPGLAAASFRPRLQTYFFCPFLK